MLDDIDFSSSASAGKIDEKVLEAAQGLYDLHIDTRRPMQSIAFMEMKTASGATVAPIPVPEPLYPLLRLLLVKLKEHQAGSKAPSFTVDIGHFRFRVEKIREHRFALRLVQKQIRNLESLNLGSSTNELLLDADFRSGGLILIAGAPGSGKTTTAVATTVARLEKFGGYCLTVERPVEIQFEGFHGEGYVEQIDASSSDFRTEVAAAMRKFPTEIKSMFFFGEVLEESGAAELTRLIGRGHLVITTIHARDIISSIEMLVSFAEQGGESYARQLIGTNLLAVVHQQLANRRPVINAVRINETMKNIICNSDTNLFMLSNELDLVKRQKYGRRATDRADGTGGTAGARRTAA